MQDNYFDRSVKMKLEGLEVPYEPADWEMMADRLDHPEEAQLRKGLAGMEVAYDEDDWFAMEDALEKGFDHAIREKLHDMDLAYQSQDWDSMEAKISDPLDVAIRNELKSASTHYLPGDWEVMEETLDKPFDELVKGKLSDHQVTYRSRDWRHMAALLRGKDEPVPLYANWRTYAAAAALLFLFLMGRQAFGPANSSIESPSVATNQGTPAQHIEKSDSDSDVNTVINAENQVAESDQNVISNEASESQTSAPGVQNQEILAEIVPNEQGIAPRIIELEGVDPSQKKLSQNKTPVISPKPTDKLAFAPYISFHTDPILKSTESLVGKVDMAQSSALNGLNENVEIRKRSQTTLLALAPMDLGESNGTRMGSLQLDQTRKADLIYFPRRVYPRVAVGLYGAGFSSVSELNDAGSFGWAVGPRVELQLNPGWSVVTGLLYAQKQFAGNILNSRENTIAGTNPVTWRSRLYADYTMLELPVMAKYKFESENKLSFYMQAGIATMITLGGQEREYNPLSLSNGVEATMAASPGLNLDGLNSSEEKVGINTYVGNVQFAPGLEARLSPHLRLQAEPYLQLGFQRMGNNKRKIYSGGAAVSIIYLLKPNK